MEVDESLVAKDIEVQLTEVNKGRKHLLGLSVLS